MTEPREVLTGLGVGESPRWHEDRLWFANWGAQEIVALGPGGEPEVIATAPKPVGYSIDWLPDGRLLVTGEENLLVREPDGALKPYADLSGLGAHWNELVVDGRGNVYVNDIGFSFGAEEFRPGSIALVTPGGTVRRVAEDVAFPNGMVVTPDNSTLIVAESFAQKLTAFDIGPDGGLSRRRVWAGVGGDGICLDADGAVWCSDMADGGAVCQRVREGGEILDRIDLDTPCFACMLGGPDGRTLFLMVADWRGLESMGDLFAARTGRVLAVPAPAPKAGRP
ncbi:sugar lactone lactonase YvrE [Prauserella shujinwangii]|uniref:Sugar lactone lactonase YvrE n=1 Tax=Prauserella shujinwangii TaxID=1453103 RepID=A0A2T0M2H1_9PSEU|nr:SMP-30/gluconolactonase/LRE family protein [Prauserella shujinwangii]PRX50951.1 sugar lactone lactonase YvrE [Prauserella shujinwangii]